MLLGFRFVCSILSFLLRLQSARSRFQGRNTSFETIIVSFVSHKSGLASAHFCVRRRSAFSFSPAVAKASFELLWRAGENEYRQKAFRSHARKSGCRYPGGFQRRAGWPAFGTRSCSQGLVCYTFCSARRAKGWCRRLRQHTFTSRKRQPKTAKA